MLHTPILNPTLNEMLGRIRHTNTLVICDRGFPYWPMIQTIDISLVNDQPSVLDVLKALTPHFTIGSAKMASQFNTHNDAATCDAYQATLGKTLITYLNHDAFKQLVPNAIGLIRTGGIAPYSNIILESA